MPARSRVISLAIAGLLCTPLGHVRAAEGTREVLLGRVALAPRLPPDLLAPEGKTRWDLTGVTVAEEFTRSIGRRDSGGVDLDDRRTRPDGDRAAHLLYSDPAGGENALRWLFPDRYGDSLRMGARRTLEVEETAERRTDRLRIDLETVGIGWVHLPSGPREVVLQRALILRAAGGGTWFVPDRLVHRFIDPRAGVVAEISGPAAADGRSRVGVDSAFVVQQVLTGAATLKIYVDELDTPAFSGIAYGFDRGPGTTVASVTPQGYTTIGQLAAANVWDFSGNTAGVAENTSTSTLVNVAETCNAPQCGYDPGGTHPGRILSREDKVTPGNPPVLAKTNAVTEREQRAGDVTVWLRGGSQNEGKTGSLGQGESRFCYSTDDGVMRSPVPLWRFPNQDAVGWYMQPGDASWVGGPFNCELNIFNDVCGGGGTFSRIYTKSCTTSSGGVHSGTQSGQVLKSGVVTLPSGHTFNALLVRTEADFCVWLLSTCLAGFHSDQVRTVIYLWQVPVIGTVVRLQSAQSAPDTDSFTTLAETDFKVGLFPPRSITVASTTDSSVALEWDPGLDAHRISGYRVYWGTSPGATAPYPFNSIDNAGQVSICGPTARITGLQPGTTYYFSVTARSAFTDPSTNVSTTYESMLYPTQVSGDPSFVYPMEVQAGTTGVACVPTSEATGLTAERVAGQLRLCWDPSSDPCVTGYEIFGAASPQSDSRFTIQAITGPVTCWTGTPAGSFFLVVPRGTGGNGPCGDYGC